jgi:periplasmic divalent cation tolerance protein
MTDYIQVVTTIDSEQKAAEIARVLVEERLAACVQVLGPITSTYRWKGRVETSREWQCMAKSRRDLYDRVEEAIRRVHSYEEPEILAVPIEAGSRSYLAWVEEQVQA